MKTRSAMGQSDGANRPTSRLAKTHEDYWKGRLRRRHYRRSDGTEVEVPEWQVKLYRDGCQRWINLETANRDLAARKARDCWLKLKTGGWDAVKPRREKLVNPTVGEFLSTVRAEADLLPVTFAIYARKFRRLVSGVAGIEPGTEKHDRFHGGHKKWLARVESVRLSRLTPDSVQRWKAQYLATAKANPLKDKKARRTIASVLRSSKALFAHGIIRKLHMQLPNPLPLSGVEIPRVSSAQYSSRIEPELLFQQAQRELEAPSDAILAIAVDQPKRPLRRPRKTDRRRNVSPATKANQRAAAIARERDHRAEMFKILCLALFAGLRRDEIDTLAWGQIDFSNHVIRIETTEHTRAKTEGSEASVDIDPTLTGRLRDWMKSSTSEFVIASKIKPRPQVSSYHHYRAGRLFGKLAAWLRTHGVTDSMAVHTLRKEFGTQINRAHGLFAASAALRHSSIQLTRAVYVAKKDRAAYPMPAATVLSGQALAEGISGAA